jgi:hypothetical protein
MRSATSDEAEAEHDDHLLKLLIVLDDDVFEQD